MDNHINQKSLKILNRKIHFTVICGIAILAVGGWFTGEAVAYCQARSMKANHRPVKVVKRIRHTKVHHSDFKPRDASATMQGSYVTYLPLKDSALSNYYQLASLIHIKGDKVCQQFLAVPKRAKQMPEFKHHIQHGHRLVPQNLKLEAKPIKGTVANLNAEATLGNLHQTATGNGYLFHTELKSYTTLTAYNWSNLRTSFGNSEPYLVTPAGKSRASFTISDSGSLINKGFRYHKITSQRAEKLLREGNGKKFFNNY